VKECKLSCFYYQFHSYGQRQLYCDCKYSLFLCASLLSVS